MLYRKADYSEKSTEPFISRDAEPGQHWAAPAPASRKQTGSDSGSDKKFPAPGKMCRLCGSGSDISSIKNWFGNTCLYSNFATPKLSRIDLSRAYFKS